MILYSVYINIYICVFIIKTLPATLIKHRIHLARELRSGFVSSISVGATNNCTAYNTRCVILDFNNFSLSHFRNRFSPFPCNKVLLILLINLFFMINKSYLSRRDADIIFTNIFTFITKQLKIFY